MFDFIRLLFNKLEFGTVLGKGFASVLLRNFFILSPALLLASSSHAIGASHHQVKICIVVNGRTDASVVIEEFLLGDNSILRAGLFKGGQKLLQNIVLGQFTAKMEVELIPPMKLLLRVISPQKLWMIFHRIHRFDVIDRDRTVIVLVHFIEAFLNDVQATLRHRWLKD